MKHIYLDYNSTTPTDPEVVNEMLPFFSENFGNPASRNHIYGINSKMAIEEARKKIAELINCSPKEIIFTSGATESANLAIKGFFQLNPDYNCNYLSIEHKAVLDAIKSLEHTNGFNARALDVNEDGIINMKSFHNDLMKTSKMLCVIMHANNEIGVIQPVEEIVAACKEQSSFTFCDAAQTIGKIPVDVKKLGVDMLSISAHKFYGPKGIGALYINRESSIKIQSQIDGGGHEKGLRSGTLNVPAIVGFGKAAELAKNRMFQDSKRITKLRDSLLKKIKSSIKGIHINGSLENRIPNNLNVSFSGVDGDSLLINMDDIAVSNGAACSSTLKEPSYVLKAIGLEDKLAEASIRFGIGRETTEEEIDYTVNKLKTIVKDLREIEEMKNSF